MIIVKYYGLNKTCFLCFCNAIGTLNSITFGQTMSSNKNQMITLSGFFYILMFSKEDQCNMITIIS